MAHWMQMLYVLCQCSSVVFPQEKCMFALLLLLKKSSTACGKPKG